MNDVKKAANKIKRMFFVLIIPDYINKKIKKRKGECRRCGKCCRNCKYFEIDKCIIYNNRPWFCYKEFPLDKYEQKIFGVKNCGYYFD